MGQFDEQSIKRIVRSVLATERMIKTHQIRSKRNRSYPYSTLGNVYLGRATTAITAADWDSDPPALGSGTVQPYNLDSAPDLSCSLPDTETWYNMAPQAVNQYAGLVAIDWQGIKLIVVETCKLIETTGCDT